MICSKRSRAAIARTTMAAGLACLFLALLAGAARAAVPQESMASFQKQLSSGQVEFVTFHPKVHRMHVSLTGGRRALVLYPPAEQQRLIEQVQAKGVKVKVAKTKPEKKPVHHKLRYIVGGIVIAVIVVVVVVLLVDRRRKVREAGGKPVA